MPKILIEIDTDTQVVVPRVPTDAMISEAENAASYFGPKMDDELGFSLIFNAMINAAPQPAPIPTGWQPIETAPTDVLHVRGLWVYDDSGKPLSFDCDTGRIDDDGFFVDEFGNVHGWRAEDYTHWHPLEVPPAPGASDD